VLPKRIEKLLTPQAAALAELIGEVIRQRQRRRF
jgi:hypothetical protein